MEQFEIIEEKECYEKASQYGNSFLKITKKDIEALHNGKILFYNDGEYGTFISMRKGE